MEKEKNQEQAAQTPEPIDLSVLVHHMLRHARRLWVLLLAVVLLGGGLMALRSVRRYTPQYKCEAVFSVSASYAGSMDITSYSYYYDNAAAKQVEATFPYILQSDVMKERLLQKLDVPFINGSISVSSVAETNIFILTVTSPSAQDAYDIICAVMDVYPQVSSLVVGTTQLSVSQEPELPTGPYNTLSWKRSAIKGAILGLAVDGILLLGLSVFSRTVSSARDVMGLLNLPCLARVPAIRRKRRSKGTAGGLVTTDMDAGSAFCESFRLLKLRLLRGLKDGQKVIMFTSSIPSEGKSTVAANTAIALAAEGKTVLLIDADLRGQSVKANLGITKPTIGLGGYLTDARESYSFARYRDTSLYVFADDEPVDSPVSLLKHAKLRSLFKELRPLVDYIVVDTPPCNMMADASILCRYADKVVYVIRKDFASRSQIFDGVQALSGSGADIGGFVLNCDSAAGQHSYGYGKYGYGKYGYGYGRKEKKSPSSAGETAGGGA